MTEVSLPEHLDLMCNCCVTVFYLLCNYFPVVWTYYACHRDSQIFVVATCCR